MSKRVLSVEQVLLELGKRIEARNPAAADHPLTVPLPQPKLHRLDAAGRNWDIRETRERSHYAEYVRAVVEEARLEFYLTSAADHDELLGAAFTHV
ncbi:hypothetical protein [Cupriavidus sp. UME77]|uniref:hypothetical protein n=1 Tax=Cupriavidus sp. UME77 TaxID=1862321 RepID=UPI0016026370|nr:hypothetical protein [Cupriavidus sp. UME77]MBB1635884.1 hypothetical protein [Cupriavidus sp. UME77]